MKKLQFSRSSGRLGACRGRPGAVWEPFRGRRPEGVWESPAGRSAKTFGKRRVWGYGGTLRVPGAIWGRPGAVLGLSCGCHRSRAGRVWGRPGGIPGPFRECLGCISGAPVPGRPGSVWDRPGGVLGASSEPPGGLKGFPEMSLGAPGDLLGASRGSLGTSRVRPEAVAAGAVLGQSWGHPAVVFTQFFLQ